MASKGCIGISLAVAIVLIIIILMQCIVLLPLAHIALSHNTITNNVYYDAGVYYPGRYLLGFGHSFVPFPSTLVTVDLTDEIAQAQGGSAIYIDASFQYKYVPENLTTMYKEFKDTYHKTIKNSAPKVLAQVTTGYALPDFFGKRVEIGEVMKTKLEEHFAVKGFVTVVFFQLRNVDVPDAYETQVIETQIQAQNVRKVTFEQSARKIILSAEAIVAQADKNITVIESEADRKARNITAVAQAQAIEIVNNATATAYEGLKTKLGLSSDEMLNYVELELFRSHSSSYIVTGDAGKAPFVSV
eukprot:TRINITY_DN3079_c3_g3_i1.p1 TRINITY_DN3079_c3_g3~~TRINITY_DN3079_c3_g3_i1.p1  ORF type:complete len:311 (+),score=75.70 TRINITY_DN3079_c3_g3_i1:33-935(+)